MSILRHSATLEPFPWGKRFAVSLVDDTDHATLQQVRPVYECLRSSGFRTTKTVWAFASHTPSGNFSEIDTISDTLESDEYRVFCQQLQSNGFEIALHTSSAGNSFRENTIQAYEVFKKYFHDYPKTNVMHSRNRENIYWGKDTIPNPLISFAISLFDDNTFEGHIKSSPYYWGDICRQRSKYVRFLDSIKPNTFQADPSTPFHDPDKPDVNWWFSSSYGAGTRLFELLKKENIQQLRLKRGASIIHYYARYYGCRTDNAGYIVHPRFQDLMTTMQSYSDGWYVPVSELLDRVIAVRNLSVSYSGRCIQFCNLSDETLYQVAVSMPEGSALYQDECLSKPLKTNLHQQILLGDIRAGGKITCWSTVPIQSVSKPQDKKTHYPILAAHMFIRLAWQYIIGGRRSWNGNERKYLTELSRPYTS